MSREIGRSIYGSSDGAWLIVEAPIGQIPPPTIGGLQCLGDPGDVFAMLNRTIDQTDIAKLAGVSQQTVSRFISGTAKPRLTDEGWQAVVRAMHNRERVRSLPRWRRSKKPRTVSK